MKTKRRLGISIIISAFLGLLPVAVFAAPPQVITVPWRGAMNLPHETYNGKAIHLKGVAHNVTAGATATWNPGDGSGIYTIPAAQIVVGSNYGLEKIHTYPNSGAGTPYTATLTVCNGADCSSAQYKVVVKNRTLNTEVNIAIDDALWYLHRTQTRGATDGNWPKDTYYVSTYGDQATPTASAVQAFEINNHFETGDAAKDPYVDDVKRGLKYIFTRLGTLSIGAQPAGNPEAGQAAPNGLGVYVPGAPRPNYDTGIVMDAIVSSKTPGAVATTGPAGIVGRTYKDIVQDMVDFYVWGQADQNCYYRGGWRYGINACDSDNSVAQWAGIGILAARDLFGCTVPGSLYSENLIWLNTSAAKSGGNAYGYGYTGAGSGIATSPSGLVQLVMDGIPKTDTARWVGVENYLASQWNGWYRDITDYYGLFSLAKAMRLALPDPIVQMAPGTAYQIDWFNKDCANPAACNAATEKWGAARSLIRDQNANGMIAGSTSGYMDVGSLSHSMGTIILTGTLEVPPVAVANAHPNPAANGQAVSFDGSGSYQPDPSKSIVKYEWDFNNDGVFDANGITASNTFPNCASFPCNFPVTLKVTDNSTPNPLIGTETINVSVTVPPHPPTANAGGPYWVCANETLKLDGSKSYDVDATFGDFITSYNWELNLVAPYDFAEASGGTPTVTWTYATGTRDIGLRVTDNTAVIFPTSGQPNLSDDNFTTVNAWDCSCFGTLIARAKPGKIDLAWPPVNGAASYDIWRSTVGPNTGFARIAANYVTTYAAYADFGLINGTTYWYRVVPNPAAGAQVCGGSKAASARPMAR